MSYDIRLIVFCSVSLLGVGFSESWLTADWLPHWLLAFVPLGFSSAVPGWLLLLLAVAGRYADAASSVVAMRGAALWEGSKSLSGRPSADETYRFCTRQVKYLVGIYALGIWLLPGVTRGFLLFTAGPSFCAATSNLVLSLLTLRLEIPTWPSDPTDNAPIVDDIAALPRVMARRAVFDIDVSRFFALLTAAVCTGLLLGLAAEWSLFFATKRTILAVLAITLILQLYVVVMKDRPPARLIRGLSALLRIRKVDAGKEFADIAPFLGRFTSDTYTACDAQEKIYTLWTILKVYQGTLPKAWTLYLKGTINRLQRGEPEQVAAAKSAPRPRTPPRISYPRIYPRSSK